MEVPRISGKNKRSAWRIRGDGVSIEFVAKADVENARNHRVHAIFRMSMRHQSRGACMRKLGLMGTAYQSGPIMSSQKKCARKLEPIVSAIPDHFFWADISVCVRL
jgi:hypothetical protein